MKLWDKGYSTDAFVEEFTVGRDRELDLYLAEADVLGNMAHMKMLNSIGLLSDDDREALEQGLKKIYKQVQAGDTLIAFDPSEVRKAILDYEDRLIVSKAELEKMQAQHELDMESLNADYEVTRISHEITRMQLEAASHESEIKRREIQLNLDKADISLARAKEQIENRRKIQAEEMKQKRLSIRQDEERLEEAHRTLDKLSVIAPAPGIAIISRNWSTNNKFQHKYL